MSSAASKSPLLREPDTDANGHRPFDRAWRSGLLLGFVLLLLLILFVIGIGYRQMEATHARFQDITGQHMQKVELTNAMHLASRNRTLLMQKIILMRDPFEQDAARMSFEHYGSEFNRARTALLGLELSSDEREKLDGLMRLIAHAVPIQQQLIDLVYAERLDEAERMLLDQALPAQDTLLAALSDLDLMSQAAAKRAAQQASQAYLRARNWMLGLSSAALALGLMVAVLVFRQANQASRKCEHMATHDALTGMPNRLLLADRLGQAIAHARRERRKLGVMFVDLDNFKLVNDSLGHAVGDELIRAVADRIRTSVRAEDTVARVGGDEFVVVVGGAATVDDLVGVAEHLCSAMQQPFQLAGQEMYAACSIGLSVYPEDGDTPETLLKNADIALYHAKEAGRGCHRLFDPTMNGEAMRRLELETAMHRGVERDEFVLYYQPQIDRASGAICGAEALLRWNHPQRGLVPPSEFLGLAERSDLILQIGQRSLLAACRQCRAWIDLGHTELKVAINLSGREFWHSDIVGVVREALEATALSPQRLQIELTEGILMENVDLAVERVRALKALGVMIAVDDFGTGYSSLAHLKRFPIDLVKIDRYFVKDIERHPTDRAIVRAILALADSLYLEVVVEGVESAAQVNVLLELGCTQFQGYHFCPPLPADRLLAWLEAYGAGQAATARVT